MASQRHQPAPQRLWVHPIRAHDPTYVQCLSALYPHPLPPGQGILKQTGCIKSMGPDGMYPQVLRKLADVLERPLLLTCKRPWHLGEVPEAWRKTNATPVSKKVKKEDSGNSKPVSLTLKPGKVIKQQILAFEGAWE